MGCHCVREVIFVAEFLHELSNSMEVASRHCREEMVFDLIIEVSAPPAGDRE